MVDGVVVNAPGGATTTAIFCLGRSRASRWCAAPGSLTATDALAVSSTSSPATGTAQPHGRSGGRELRVWQGRAGASADRAPSIGALRSCTSGPTTRNPTTRSKKRRDRVVRVARLRRASLAGFSAHQTAWEPGPDALCRPDLDAYATRKRLHRRTVFETRGESVVTRSAGHLRQDQLRSIPRLGSVVPTFGVFASAVTVFDFVDRSDSRTTLGGRAWASAADPGGASNLITIGAEAERETGELGSRNDPFAS